MGKDLPGKDAAGKVGSVAKEGQCAELLVRGAQRRHYGALAERRNHGGASAIGGQQCCAAHDTGVPAISPAWRVGALQKAVFPAGWSLRTAALRPAALRRSSGGERDGGGCGGVLDVVRVVHHVVGVLVVPRERPLRRGVELWH